MNSISLKGESGEVLPGIDITASMLINKTLNLYGRTGAGKTVIIKHCLEVLRGKCKECIVICPTQISDRPYEGVVRESMIHYALTSDPARVVKTSKTQAKSKKTKTLPLIEQIWARQSMKASIYHVVNDLDSLRLLYERFPDDSVEQLIDKIENIFAKLTLAVDQKTTIDSGKKHKMKEKIKADETAILVKIYRRSIKDHIQRNDYESIRDYLTEKESYTLEHFNFNPNLLLIMDDCASELKEYQRHEVLRKLYYQGRHLFITLIVAAQDDTDLPANLRKNTYISIFLEEITARANFNRSSNNFSKAFQRRVEEFIPLVFTGKKDDHKKLVYINAEKKLYHTTVLEYVPRYFGPPVLQKLCKKVEQTDTSLDKQNPYYATFNPSRRNRRHFRDKFLKKNEDETYDSDE